MFKTMDDLVCEKDGFYKNKGNMDKLVHIRSLDREQSKGHILNLARDLYLMFSSVKGNTISLKKPIFDRRKVGRSLSFTFDFVRNDILNNQKKSEIKAQNNMIKRELIGNNKDEKNFEKNGKTSTLKKKFVNNFLK